MKTVIVWITAEQKIDADKACKGMEWLEPPTLMVAYPKGVKILSYEHFWRYEVPESAYIAHPHWRIERGRLPEEHVSTTRTDSEENVSP